MFALTNGFHDAANAIATLVVTRGAKPGQAIVLSAGFNVLGVLLAGTAVAGTIAGITTVRPSLAVAVIGAGVLASVVWNVLTWVSGCRRALVMRWWWAVGSALASSGIDAVRWGGFDSWKPVGVFGVLVALAVSPAIGLALGFGLHAFCIVCCAVRPLWCRRRSAGPSGR